MFEVSRTKCLCLYKRQRRNTHTHLNLKTFILIGHINNLPSPPAVQKNTFDCDNAPRIREWCVLVSAELVLDGRQPLLTLPQLRLGEAVSVLRAQGVAQLLQGLEVLPCLGEAAIHCKTSLLRTVSTLLLLLQPEV